jgi:hypothetical protein
MCGTPSEVNQNYRAGGAYRNLSSHALHPLNEPLESGPPFTSIIRYPGRGTAGSERAYRTSWIIGPRQIRVKRNSGGLFMDYPEIWIILKAISDFWRARPRRMRKVQPYCLQTVWHKDCSLRFMLFPPVECFFPNVWVAMPGSERSCSHDGAAVSPQRHTP